MRTRRVSRQALRVFVVAALAWVLPAAAAAQLTLAERQALLELHNHERCVVSPAAQTMPALIWDENLAAVAQRHASACVVTHNAHRSTDYADRGGSGYVGENIASASSGFTVEAMALLWANEKSSWVYGPLTSENFLTTGHYTQMIWANTTRIGCGLALCGSTRFLVCDYAPGGNVMGQAPYADGTCRTLRPLGALRGRCAWARGAGRAAGRTRLQQ